MSNTQEEDFLGDPQVRGQNYCCISFVSPENILNNKDVFKMNKFLANMHDRYKKMEAVVKEHVPETEIGQLFSS